MTIIQRLNRIQTMLANVRRDLARHDGFKGQADVITATAQAQAAVGSIQAAYVSRDKGREYPECYLHVRDERSGEEWIREIGEDETLDLRTLLGDWIGAEFSGELAIDGEIMPAYAGDYFAKIMTDGRSPDSGVCWTSGGFYLRAKQ